jgi:hypothetical protein
VITLPKGVIAISISIGGKHAPYRKGNIKGVTLMEDLCRPNMIETSCVVFFSFGVDVFGDLFVGVHFLDNSMGFKDNVASSSRIAKLL